MSLGKKTPTLDSLFEEVEYLRQGQRLLERIWVHLDHQQLREFPMQIQIDLDRHFGIDDSE